MFINIIRGDYRQMMIIDISSFPFQHLHTHQHTHLHLDAAAAAAAAAVANPPPAPGFLPDPQVTKHQVLRTFIQSSISKLVENYA